VIFMPLQNWPGGFAATALAAGAEAVAAVVAAVVAALLAAAVVALGVALLLQPVATTASAASSSGSLIKGLDIPLALLNVTGGIEGGELSLTV
jgi:hypothetical protein